MSSFWEKRFGLTAHGTTVRTELTAGLTTFAAMSYILAVNPLILSQSGMDPGAVITATALASALMTAVMASATNYPIALAPGMGMNAFFAYTICVGNKIPWPAALAMVFVSGFIFLLLSISGLRQKIIEAIPTELKLAISCGIGLFILFLGLKNAGIIVGDSVTLLHAGDFKRPSTLLAFFGIILSGVLVWKRVRGAIILSVITLTLIGLFLRDNEHMVTQRPTALVDLPASLAPTFLHLDFKYVWQNFLQLYPMILALLFVDFFDNMGTLIGVCQRAGLVDAQGRVPRLGRALQADATAAMVGACLGTSTVTSYIESAAGVEQGGRTGLTAWVVAGCFLLALFFHPLIRMVPAVATAPALVIVGVIMLEGVTRLPMTDFPLALASVLMMVLMPLTFSISEGLAIGFVVYASTMLLAGRAREVSWTAWILAALFLVHLLKR